MRYPPRIIFEYQKKLYKFLNFWVDKKPNDNSFYFHFYSDKNSKIKVPKTPIEERNLNMIDFDDYIEVDFTREHLSIHQTGIIHSKNKNGVRIKDGIYGYSFNEIKSSKLVLICGPTEITKQIPHKKIDNKRDIIMHLKEDIKPFTLHFEVFRKTEEKNLSINNPNLLFGGYINVEFDNKEFGLRIYGQNVLGKPLWPPFNFILTQIKKY